MLEILKWIVYAGLLLAVVWIVQLLIKYIRKREKNDEDES
jgi:hypothetical protein